MGGLTRPNQHVKSCAIHTFFFSILAGVLTSSCRYWHDFACWPVSGARLCSSQI